VMKRLLEVRSDREAQLEMKQAPGVVD
jgi:hypothetical protein